MYYYSQTELKEDFGNVFTYSPCGLKQFIVTSDNHRSLPVSCVYCMC